MFMSTEAKPFLRPIAALLLTIPVLFVFLKPAIWALAVVLCVWKLRQRRLLAARFSWIYSPAAMTGWAALCLLVPFSLIVGAITIEAASAAATIGDPAQRTVILAAVQSKAAMATPYLDRFGVETSGMAGRIASAVGPSLGTILSAITGAAGSLLIDSAFFLLFVYVFFSRGAAIAESLRRTLAETAGNAVEVAGTALASSLLGVVATSVLQGAVGCIGTMMTGLPSPWLFFMAMAIASLIPGVGTMLVWGPAAAWLALSGHGMAAAGLVAWGVIVISSVDSFVRPFVSSRFGNLDILVAMLGSLGGLAAFGFTGVILGPALLAAGIELFSGEEANITDPATAGC